ncbi:helix-turn-helix domain-containing protein [Specibacter sp. NPDC078692]|uniref:TetR/AcrR family transcriptional regulator n=1 Tax=Specibacter sp. NPDC078692 TaxID=3155818 RepID=UPI00343AF3BC
MTHRNVAIRAAESNAGSDVASADALSSESRQAEKFEVRRAELAAAALATLSEFGYARTSLREIAQKSGFSHGVFHYYFRDKVELITYCVREYKLACVGHYDAITSNATSAEQVRLAFAAALSASARDDTAMHRLWYDLRNQSMFADDFQADVTEVDISLETMIWTVVSCYAAFHDTEIALPRRTVYALIDGMFQQCLLDLHAGNLDAPATLQQGVWQLFPRLLAGFGIP